jgi:NitT/TauT family transport system substrate-binding protein
MRLRRPAVLAGLCLVIAVTGCNPLGGSPSGASGQTVTVAVVPGMDNATLYLAKQQGLFTSAGITMQIKDYSSVSAELAALSNGSVDIAAADYGDLFYAEANAPSPIYTIVADGYDAAPGVIEIMTMPNSSINSPSGLAGRTILAPSSDVVVHRESDFPDSLAIASATSVLNSFGVNMSLVKWQHTSQLAEISALVHSHGKPVAALLTQPYVYQAQQDGAVELADACSGATAGIPLSGYFSTRAWSNAANDKAAIAAFQSAIAQAAASAAMPGPIQKILPRYAGLNAQEAALVTTGVYPLTTNAANIQRTADLMNQQSMIRVRINVASMIVH